MLTFTIYVALMFQSNFVVKTQPFTGSQDQCRAAAAYMKSDLSASGVTVLYAKCEPNGK